MKRIETGLVGTGNAGKMQNNYSGSKKTLYCNSREY